MKVVAALLLFTLTAYADPQLRVPKPFRIFDCSLKPFYRKSVDDRVHNKSAILKKCERGGMSSYDCARDYDYQLELARRDLDRANQFMVANEWSKTNYEVAPNASGKITSQRPWYIYQPDQAYHVGDYSGYGHGFPKGTIPFNLGFEFRDLLNSSYVAFATVYFVSTNKIYPVISVDQISSGNGKVWETVSLDCKLQPE